MVVSEKCMVVDDVLVIVGADASYDGGCGGGGGGSDGDSGGGNEYNYNDGGVGDLASVLVMMVDVVGSRDWLIVVVEVVGLTIMVGNGDGCDDRIVGGCGRWFARIMVVDNDGNRDSEYNYNNEVVGVERLRTVVDGDGGCDGRGGWWLMTIMMVVVMMTQVVGDCE
ncbi:hypothetical protein FXO37_13004 [Capsicum annuum]|nr:hypothetical protein FXO37_13004 [Capsicum annuum]